MKIINEKGKLFGIINIIDLLVLLFIVAISGVGLTKTSIMKKVNVLENKRPYEIQVFIKGVLPEMAEQLEKKSIILEDSSNTVLGETTNVDITVSKSDVTTADGKIVSAVATSRKDVILTVKGEGIFDEKRGLVFGNKDWQAGAAIVIKSSKVKFAGNILKIS